MIALLRVTALLLLALAMLPLLRRHSAALRAWLLITALGGAAIVPLLQFVAPSWGTPFDLPSALAGGVSWNTLLLIWAAGAAVHLAVLAAGMLRLIAIAIAADPIREGVCADLALDIAAEYRVHAPVLLLEANRPTLPVTWGHWEPKVLLPPASRDWTRERALIVLRHEIAHVRRRDWLIQLFARIIRSVYWFHPLVWIACAQLRLECECACDDAVLRGGVDGSRYAEHLLDLARAFVKTRGPAQAAALARRSTLEYRVRAMLARGHDRSQLHRASVVALATVMLAAALAAAGYGESANEPPAVASAAPPRRLTLLLDGRIMDLSKEWPTYPDPRAGIVEGARFADAMR